MAKKEVIDIYQDNLYVTDGGIYIASNVPDSTRVWNCGVEPEVVRRLGDIEYLRAGLPGPGELCGAHAPECPMLSALCLAMFCAWQRAAGIPP